MKKRKPKKPYDVTKPYKWTSPFEYPDLSKATALTIDQLKDSIKNNRLVTITITIN